LKHVKSFLFEGKGIDQKLEKAKQKTRDQKEKDVQALQKEKKLIAEKTAKAAKAGKDSKLNLAKLKDAQKRIKKLIGK